MSKFSKESQDKLNECHPDLQRLFNKVIDIIDIKIIESHRDKETQDRYYNADPPRTKVKWPDSKHNSKPSRAVDVAPYYKDAPHIRWNDTDRFYYMQGIIKGVAEMMGIKIRQGIDWDGDTEFNEKWVDFPHVELR